MIGEMLILSVYGFLCCLTGYCSNRDYNECPCNPFKFFWKYGMCHVIARFVDGKDWLKAKNKKLIN